MSCPNEFCKVSSWGLEMRSLRTTWYSTDSECWPTSADTDVRHQCVPTSWRIRSLGWLIAQLRALGGTTSKLGTLLKARVAPSMRKSGQTGVERSSISSLTIKSLVSATPSIRALTAQTAILQLLLLPLHSSHDSKFCATDANEHSEDAGPAPRSPS